MNQASLLAWVFTLLALGAVIRRVPDIAMGALAVGSVWAAADWLNRQ